MISSKVRRCKVDGLDRHFEEDVDLAHGAFITTKLPGLYFFFILMLI